MPDQTARIKTLIGIEVSDTAVTSARNRLGCEPFPSFTVQAVPSPNRPIEQIFADQVSRRREKKARWDVKHDGIRIELRDPGPYGIVLFGDPHVDDDGAALEQLDRPACQALRPSAHD